MLLFRKMKKGKSGLQLDVPNVDIKKDFYTWGLGGAFIFQQGEATGRPALTGQSQSDLSKARPLPMRAIDGPSMDSLLKSTRVALL